MPSEKLVVSVNSAWNIVNFRRGLVRALHDRGFQIVVIAPDDGYADQVRALGCRFIPVTLSRRGRSITADLRLAAQYVKILRAEKPAAYLGYTIKPNIYGSLAAQWLGIPVLANVAGLGTAFQRAGMMNRLVKWLYRLALRRAAVVFFQNEEDRSLFVEERLVDLGRAQLLPGSGIDLEHFAPAVRAGTGGVTFLLIARLLWAKGIREYATAADSVRKQHPDAAFRLIGIPETAQGAVDPAALEDWHKRGVIEYLGAFDDVRPHIAAADCIVLPSYYPEGTPRVLLEAAAMATPLITTDTPGCRTVVHPEGDNGFLCQPRDSRSLADAMMRFCALSPRDRKRMGDASRAWAEERFDERKVIDAYIRALETVAADPSRP